LTILRTSYKNRHNCPKAKLWPILLAILFAWFLWGCPAKKEAPAGGSAAEVKDGDTIVLTDGRKVRYLGMDTPELSSTNPKELEMARLAKKVNAELIQGVKLRLEYDVERYDQYNRLLAYVFLADGRMVNEELVRRGLARVLLKFPNLRFRDELIKAQREAITNRVGLWQELPVAQEDHYVGNIRSYRFHRPNCPGAQTIAPGNRRLIKTPLEAYWEGYSPAKDCFKDGD
jgi:micrococcal nuclease